MNEVESFSQSKIKSHLQRLLENATPDFSFDPFHPQNVFPFHTVFVNHVTSSLSDAYNYIAHNIYTPGPSKEILDALQVHSYNSGQTFHQVTEVDERSSETMKYPYASLIKPFVLNEFKNILLTKNIGPSTQFFPINNGDSETRKYSFYELTNVIVRENQGSSFSNLAFTSVRDFVTKYYELNNTSEEQGKGFLILESNLRTLLPTYTLRKPYRFEDGKMIRQSTFEMDCPNLGTFEDLVTGFEKLIQLLEQEKCYFGQNLFPSILLDALTQNDTFATSSAALFSEILAFDSKIKVYNMHGIIPLDTFDIPQLALQGFPSLSGLLDVCILKFPDGSTQTIGYTELIEMGLPRVINNEGMPLSDKDGFFQYAAIIRSQLHEQGFKTRYKQIITDHHIQK